MTPPPAPELTAAGSPPARRMRWWPAIMIVVVAVGLILAFQLQDTPFQRKNLQTLVTLVLAGGLLFLWWVGASRARPRLKWSVAGIVLAGVALAVGMFRIRGVSGDLLPILEPRWQSTAQVATTVAPSPPVPPPAPASPAGPRLDFPQFLGPDRTAMLPEVRLEVDWQAHPPEVLWRQAVGAAWSGFAVVGERALTQEQRGEQEAVVAYDLASGRSLWTHTDPAHYATTIAGEGPRCTPTIVSNRVFTLGATGLLNALDLATGHSLWRRQIAEETGARVPEWGFAGSPLVHAGRVIVSAGGPAGKSVLAFDAETGAPVWAGGDVPISYSSLVVAELAGVPQVLAFHHRRITAQDVQTGAVLWAYPWGVGQPQVAIPLVTASNRVVFSSGYGVGAELLEVTRTADAGWAASRVWQSRRMKAKFANLVTRDGFLYGLDDGILACLDLRDGAQRWKEGRYGHGQGLLLGEHFLLMAENGELVLLYPTPEAPNELHRFRVFPGKTWNPIALAGDRLLVRNDREAACLRVRLAGTGRP